MPEIRSIDDDTNSEARYYIRVPSVVPVDFQLISSEEGPLDPTIRTGITRDFSQSGLCLNVSALPRRIAKRLEDKQLDGLLIAMDIAMPRRTLRVGGRIVWAKVLVSGARRRYRIGVQFQHLAPEDGQAIIDFAKRAASRPKFARAALAGLTAATLIVGAGYLWNDHVHRLRFGAAKARITEANQRYQGVASELEALTTDLLDIAADVRVEISQQAAASPSDSDQYEPEIIASAIQELRGSLDGLRAQLRQLRARRAGASDEVPDSEAEVASDMPAVADPAKNPALPGGSASPTGVGLSPGQGVTAAAASDRIGGAPSQTAVPASVSHAASHAAPAPSSSSAPAPAAAGQTQ